jgi:hypothetical protein
MQFASAPQVYVRPPNTLMVFKLFAPSVFDKSSSDRSKFGLIWLKKLLHTSILHPCNLQHLLLYKPAQLMAL